mmetsp:Transcript_14438/g.36262  ORF Transcript_14438/g.36262 Transcript_14438/m.36262 type:complete len:258 (+) Transcript_14438:374-1147(+)
MCAIVSAADNIVGSNLFNVFDFVAGASVGESVVVDDWIADVNLVVIECRCYWLLEVLMNGENSRIDHFVCVGLSCFLLRFFERALCQRTIGQGHQRHQRRTPVVVKGHNGIPFVATESASSSVGLIGHPSHGGLVLRLLLEDIDEILAEVKLTALEFLSTRSLGCLYHLDGRNGRTRCFIHGLRVLEDIKEFFPIKELLKGHGAFDAHAAFPVSAESWIECHCHCGYCLVFLCVVLLFSRRLNFCFGVTFYENVCEL